MKRYELLKQIGKGSFGVVYKCRLKQTGQYAALKLIQTYGKSQQELESLEKETELLKQMESPFIIRVVDHFREDGNICIATELAECDLFDIISKMNYENLTDEQLKSFTATLQKISAQMLLGLQHLHARGVAHRDIKPQNVLLVNGACKLCDFGFAKAGDLTSLKGSPLYLAPEIAKQRPYSVTADVWSLGVTVFELACGKPPYVKEDQAALIRFLAEDRLDVPWDKSQIFGRVPQLKSFVEVCMRKAPEKRLSVDQLLKHPFVSGCLVAARSTAVETRNWYAAVAKAQEVREEANEVVAQAVNTKQLYAEVTQVDIVDSNQQLELLEKKSPVLKLIFDVYRTHGKRFDDKFALIEHCIVSPRSHQDYAEINAKKFEADGKQYYEHLDLKLDFLLFLVLNEQGGIFYDIIEILKSFISKELDAKGRRLLIILMRVVCGLLGCRTQFQVPLVFGEQVNFPYDIHIFYDDLKIPKLMTDKIQFTQRIHQTYQLINLFSKPKQLSDVVEMLVKLWKDGAGANPDRREQVDHNHLLYLFQVAIQSIIGVSQALYTEFILHLPNPHMIQTKVNELNGEITRSIDYDISIQDVQQNAIPCIGKKIIPDYMLKSLSPDEQQAFLETLDQGKYFFMTITNLDDQIDFVIESVTIITRHLMEHLPSITNATFQYLKRNIKVGEASSVRNIVDDSYSLFIKQMSGQMFGNARENVNIIQFTFEQIQSIFEGLNILDDLDFTFDCVVLRKQFINVVAALQDAQVVILPILFMSNQEEKSLYCIKNPSFRDLITESDLDEFVICDQLTKNMPMEQFMTVQNLQKFKKNFQMLLSILPFVRLTTDVQIPSNIDKTSARYIKIDEEKAYLTQYHQKSLQILINMFFPPINNYFALLTHMLKELSTIQGGATSLEIAIDEISIPVYKEFVLALQNQLPCRNNYILTHSSLSCALSFGKMQKLPNQITYNFMTLSGASFMKYSTLFLFGWVSKFNVIPILINEVFQGSIIYMQKLDYKVSNQFIIGQVNKHLSQIEQEINSDFLYQGVPYLATVQKEEAQETATNNYCTNNQNRIVAFQMLYLLCQNKDIAKELMQTSYQMDNSEEKISFISILLISSFWLMAYQQEEDARLSIILQLFQQDAENSIIDLLTTDCEIIKKGVQIMQEKLSTLFILDFFLLRLYKQIQNTATEVVNSQEKFSTQMGAIEHLDKVLFGEIEEQLANPIDFLFKYPKYYLSTGTAITLPIVNEIKENEIALNIVSLSSSIIAVVAQNIDVQQQINASFEKQVPMLCTQLNTIMDCLVVENAQFTMNQIGSNTLGALDGIIELISKVRTPGVEYATLFHKIAVLTNLQHQNSLLQAWQAGHCCPHHPSQNQTQFECALKGCTTCLYNMNGIRLEKTAYYEHILRLNAQQQNRKYQNVYWHWAFILSNSGWNSLLKAINNLILFMNEKKLQIEDKLLTNLVREVTRNLCERMKEHKVKTQMLLVGQAESEIQFNTSLTLLYNLVVLNEAAVEICVEQNIIQSVLSCLNLMKQVQTLSRTFSFVQGVLKSKRLQIILIGQFVASGALCIDYFNYVFSEQLVKVRDSPVADFLHCLSFVAAASKNYVTLLEGAVVKEQIIRAFEAGGPKIKSAAVALVAHLCGEVFAELSQYFIAFAIQQIQNSQSEPVMLVQCLNLLINCHSSYAQFQKQILQSAQAVTLLLNDPELSVRASAIRLLARVCTDAKQVEGPLIQLINQAQSFSIQLKPAVDAVEELGRRISANGRARLSKKLRALGLEEVAQKMD